MTLEKNTNEFHISCMEDEDQTSVGINIPDSIIKHLELNQDDSITLYPIFNQQNPPGMKLIKFKSILSKSNIPLPHTS